MDEPYDDVALAACGIVGAPWRFLLINVNLSRSSVEDGVHSA